jgi:class 3 adenylate cyclase
MTAASHPPSRLSVRLATCDCPTHDALCPTSTTPSARYGPLPVSPCRCGLGVATGPVVVGDVLGAGSVQEQVVVGETPHLAARLQPEAH